MIGGPIGWPIGGIIPDDGTDFPVSVNVAVSASTSILRAVTKPLSIGLDLTATDLFSVAKSVAPSVGAAVSVIKSASHPISVAVDLAATLLRTAIKPVVAALSAATDIVVARFYTVVVQAGLSASSSIAKATAKVVSILVRLIATGSAGNALSGDLGDGPAPGSATLLSEAAPSSATLQDIASAAAATLQMVSAPASANLVDDTAPTSRTLHPKIEQTEF